MADIVVRSRTTGPIVMAAVNAALAGFNGWRWYEGSGSTLGRWLTIVPAVILFFNILSILWPVQLRLSDGRLLVRPGWAAGFSTARENVVRFDVVGGQVFLRFADPGQVDAGAWMRKVFEVNQSGGASHLVLPLKAAEADVERLKSAMAER